MIEDQIAAAVEKARQKWEREAEEKRERTKRVITVLVCIAIGWALLYSVLPDIGQAILVWGSFLVFFGIVMEAGH